MTQSEMKMVASKNHDYIDKQMVQQMVGSMGDAYSHQLLAWKNLQHTPPARLAGLNISRLTWLEHRTRIREVEEGSGGPGTDLVQENILWRAETDSS